jgi:hypothetical protein
MEMINEKKASELIGVCPATLRSWRLKNLISKDLYEKKSYYKISRVVYKEKELLKWAKDKEII